MCSAFDSSRAVEWTYVRSSASAASSAAQSPRRIASKRRSSARSTSASIPVSSVAVVAMTLLSSLLEVVNDRGVLHQDTVPSLLVGHPVAEQIEQHRVVGHAFLLLGRVRPVAAPHAAFGISLGVGTRDCAGVGVRRGGHPRVGVGAGELDATAALVH